MSWLLIVVFLILAACAAAGHKKGFIRTVFGIFSLGIALLAASALSPVCSRILQNNEKVFGFVKEHVERRVETEDQDSKADQIETIRNLKVPEAIKNKLIEHNNRDVYKQLGIETFQDYLLYHLTGMIINSVVFLILFLLCRLLLLMIANAMDLVSRLPVLNELNRAAGVFAGIIEGLAVIWILCIVLTVFSATETGMLFFEEIGKSPLLSAIYNNNLLLEAITKLI